jgi:putative ABC transport system permease protein
MFKNYFKTAWRNLMKNKVFSFINIVGLSIGLAACLLILQYVSFELSYDQFNKNADDIYRIVNDRYQYGKLVQHGTITYSAIGKAMQDDFPEVVDHTRVLPFGSKNIITNGDKKIGDQTVLAVDNSFLSMFSYPMITGDAKTGLKDPFDVILSESTARKIFDIKNNDFNKIIGKTILIGSGSPPYKITAVSNDAPENSHLKFDMLVSYTTVLAGNQPYKQADYDFTDSDFWHYIQLKHGTDYKELQAKFDAFSQRHFQGNKVSGSDEKFYLQPLGKAHLYSDFEYEIGDTASATVVWGLLAIAVLIIIIAWVNYINLATAKSMERAKEVGVRKVAGATRQQLIKQFLTESFIINVIALLIAILLVTLLQSNFNNLVQHQLSLSDLFKKGPNDYTIAIAFGTLLLLGVLASGFYPAFVLSSFKPILVLKGKFTKSGKGIILRKALVVGQFAITVALIVGSVVIYQQIKFMNTQQLGMNINQILVVNPPLLSSFDSSFIDKENSFKHEIEKITYVRGATTSNFVAGDEMSRAFDVHFSGDNTATYSMRNMGADADFINVYDIKLLAGRNFELTDYNPDYNKLHNILINDNAAKMLGFNSDKDAVGKSIMMFNKQWDIVGVINNYHQKSLRYALEPLILQPFYNTGNPISVKVDPKNLSSTMAQIKSVYESFFPGNIFNYYFLDEKFNKQYANDELFGKAFAIFAGFAILIACLGLFGLSLFATMQRTKEIGVRKVLGASVSNIVMMLSKDFIRLVIIAFVIASPVAWLVMNNWLNDFAYRININAWIFAGAGLLAIVIALATISFQAIKAAVANPVKSLRTE